MIKKLMGDRRMEGKVL